MPKSDGTKRWCMDLRPSNAVAIRANRHYETRQRIQEARYFTRLDMQDGYHHMKIRKGNEHLTAFITEYRLYEWTVACFEFKNAPAELARYRNNKDEAEHWEHVERVLPEIDETEEKEHSLVSREISFVTIGN